MVEFVLEESREQFVGLDRDFLARQIDAAKQNFLWSDHLDVETRYRKASFFIDPLARGFDDFRVDENIRAVANVVDEQLLLDTDLRGRETDTGRVVHDVEHLVGEAHEFVVDLLDLERRRLQNRISVCTNFVRHAARLSVMPDQFSDKGSSHYFDVDDGDFERLGSSPREVTWSVLDASLVAESDRGVFSYGRLDRGTSVLFDLVPAPPPGGAFLDIGCGWGAIALSLAALSPAAKVYAVDVNPRALELTLRNASRLGLTNLHVSHPDDVHPGISFDLIWSNPPIRVGKDVLHSILDRWLPRLTPGGSAYLVVQKNLGSDSLAGWLVARGYDVERVGSRKGFRVLRIARTG